MCDYKERVNVNVFQPSLSGLILVILIGEALTHLYNSDLDGAILIVTPKL